MFIGNRIAEIRELTRPEHWNYVNTKHNPADQGTRGLSAKQMTENSLWIKGPAFLEQDAEFWPEQPIILKQCFLASTNEQPIRPRFTNFDPKIIDTQRFSQWLRLRHLVYSIKKLRKPHTERAELLKQSEQFLFQLSQQQSFEEEINHLNTSGRVLHRSRLISCTPFIDNFSLIRSNSRLRNSEATLASATPILLDARNRIVQLYVKSCTRRKEMQVKKHSYTIFNWNSGYFKDAALSKRSFPVAEIVDDKNNSTANQ